MKGVDKSETFDFIVVGGGSAGAAERRPNLTIITGARATRVLLHGPLGEMEAKGIEK